jgi:hypothetical protein
MTLKPLRNLLHDCPNYAVKVWPLVGHPVTKALAKYYGYYVPALVLTPLELVYNKSHLSILLHVKDATTPKIIILLFSKNQTRYNM